jgi:hypothetical protein
VSKSSDHGDEQARAVCSAITIAYDVVDNLVDVDNSFRVDIDDIEQEAERRQVNADRRRF